jgi:hypothetical protein
MSRSAAKGGGVQTARRVAENVNQLTLFDYRTAVDLQSFTFEDITPKTPSRESISGG